MKMQSRRDPLTADWNAQKLHHIIETLHQCTENSAHHSFNQKLLFYLLTPNIFDMFRQVTTDLPSQKLGYSYV